MPQNIINATSSVSNNSAVTGAQTSFQHGQMVQGFVDGFLNNLSPDTMAKNLKQMLPTHLQNSIEFSDMQQFVQNIQHMLLDKGLNINFTLYKNKDVEVGHYEYHLQMTSQGLEVNGTTHLYQDNNMTVGKVFTQGSVCKKGVQLTGQQVVFQSDQFSVGKVSLDTSATAKQLNINSEVTCLEAHSADNQKNVKVGKNNFQAVFSKTGMGLQATGSGIDGEWKLDQDMSVGVRAVSVSTGIKLGNPHQNISKSLGLKKGQTENQVKVKVTGIELRFNKDINFNSQKIQTTLIGALGTLGGNISIGPDGISAFAGTGVVGGGVEVKLKDKL